MNKTQNKFVYYEQCSYICIKDLQNIYANVTKNNMKRLRRATQSFADKMRGVQVGEQVIVYAEDCRETLLRSLVSKLKKDEGKTYKVSAIGGNGKYCTVTRLA